MHWQKLSSTSKSNYEIALCEKNLLDYFCRKKIGFHWFLVYHGQDILEIRCLKPELLELVSFNFQI